MAWSKKGYIAPTDAHDNIVRVVAKNNVNVDLVTLDRLISLSKEYQHVYSKYLTRDKGLQKDGERLGPDEFNALVNDPYNLKDQLSNFEGGEYSPLELAFLISTHILCNSKIAPRTIGTLATKRKRDKIATRLGNVKGL